MKNYKELYEHHEEDNKLHIGIAEVEQAEHELQDMLDRLLGNEDEIKDTLDNLIGNEQELKDVLDLLIGKIARAYEMQGFSFGYDLATAKEARA